MLNGNGRTSKENPVRRARGGAGQRVTPARSGRSTASRRRLKVPPPPPSQAMQRCKCSKRSNGQDDLLDRHGAQGVRLQGQPRQPRGRIELYVCTTTDGDKGPAASPKNGRRVNSARRDAEPAAWFKDATSALGDIRIAAHLLTNLGFGRRATCFLSPRLRTADLSRRQLIGKVMGQEQKPITPSRRTPPHRGPPGAPPVPRPADATHNAPPVGLPVTAAGPAWPPTLAAARAARGLASRWAGTAPSLLAEAPGPTPPPQSSLLRTGLPGSGQREYLDRSSPRLITPHPTLVRARPARRNVSGRTGAFREAAGCGHPTRGVPPRSQRTALAKPLPCAT